ncbi:chalcone isomerase family protein [Allohahella marinimesophila]|uniref:Chalcone isomerase family protein n=1 Tax=Allohahella marinimesophila TaxID=1054972 RepID=A0ABP7NJ90_9GAMM
MINQHLTSTVSPLAVIRVASLSLFMAATTSIILFQSAYANTEPKPAAEIVGDQSGLVLNGFATRKFLFMVDVYVGSLYVERKSRDPRALMSADEHRVMQFDLLRDVRGRRIANAFYEGMQLNVSPEKIQSLEPQISQLLTMFDQKLETGDTAIVEYIPEVGTRVVLAGQEKGVIPGKELFDAILSIWIGEYPVSETFKEGILGMKS